MKIRFLLTFLSLFLVIRSNAQYYNGTTSGGGAPGTTKRSPLNTLERSPNVAGRTILTDAVGNQRWADFVEIEPTPIPFVPTSTGNVAFLSSFVTAPNGNIYYIDWFGRSILIRAAGAATADKDWLKISDNSVPQLITDSIYTDNYAAINMRRVWPNAHLLVGDSTALTGANTVIVGNRDARVGFYRLTDNAWSSIGQEGGSLTARLGTGTSSLLVQTAAGASSSQPAGPFRNIFEIRKDSLIRLYDYPTVRRDTQSGTNYLYTDAQGYLRSKEFTGGGIAEVTGVNTISQLSALTNARSEQTAFVKDSLRGGTFMLKTASGNTIDNGIVFPSAILGSVWVRQYSGYRNALWYGVKNDGVTDNTLLYPPIFLSMPVSSSLYFPTGTYKGDIVLDGRVTIEGNGLSSILVSTTTGNAITLTNHPIEIGKLVIHNFKILGYNAIVFSTPVANKWQFRDIVIEVSNIGVKKEHGNIYNTFENISVYGAQYGLWAVNSPLQTMHTGGDLWLKCRFVNSAKAGVYINDQSFGSGSLVFQQCFFEGNFGFGVFVKQFGESLVVSAPSLRFVDCWNEANFVAQSVTIDGITYDSLNTVKVSKAVAIFDGSPCALDARDYGFVTFQNLKTDGVENYVRTDNTSFVQYKNCGLSRVNEGNVIFDGLAAFARGNQNSAQIPSRDLKVNHPKTKQTINFSDITTVVPGLAINGGIMYDRCRRFTLSGSTTNLNSIPITAGKIGLWTIDVRNRSTATNFQLVGIQSLGTVHMSTDTMWHTYAGILVNPLSGNAGINLPTGTGTIDLSAFQYLEFDDMKEAIEYWNSGGYSTGRSIEATTGAGTVDYLTKFITPSTIGNSQIRDNGTAVGIAMPPNNTFRIGINGHILQSSTNPYSLMQNGGSNFFVSGSSANISGGPSSDFDAFLYGNNTYNILTNGAKRITLKGDGSIGFNTISPQPLSIHLQGLNGISLPATSGTTQNGLMSRFSTTATTSVLDFGNNSANGIWLQVTDNSSLASTYPLLFNPIGGNVGIGLTTVPTSRLDVNGTVTSNGVQTNGNQTVTGTSAVNGISTVNNSIILNGVAGGANTFIQLRNNNANIALFGSDAGIFGGSASDFSSFVYGNNNYFIATNSVKRMTITGTGNVGIGLTNPSERLDVAGNLKCFRVHSTINQRSVLSARVTTDPADEIALLFKVATPVDSFEIRQTNGVYNFAVNNTDRMSFVPQENAVQMNAAFRKKLTSYTSEPSNLTNDVGTAVITGLTTVNFNLPDIVGSVVNANQVRVGTEYTIIVDKTTATNINAAAGDTIKQGGTIPGTSTIIVPALNVYTRTYIAGASNTWYVTN